MEKRHVNLRFWLSFFISVIACGLVAFFAGWLTAEFQGIRQEEALYKKSLKLDHVFFLEHLNKKMDFLSQEVQKIQIQNSIPSDSPFMALVVLQKSQVKNIYKGEAFALSNSKQRGDSRFETAELARLSQKALAEAHSQASQLVYLDKTELNEKALVLFVQSSSLSQRQVAFFKMDKSFFRLPLDSSRHPDKEVFVANQKGRILFHSRPGQIFKVLSKDTPVFASLNKSIGKEERRSWYLKSKSRKRHKEIYYFQKWNQDFFLSVRTGYLLPLFLSGDFYEITWILIVVVFILFFIILCFKVSLLAVSYRFLKMAFISFAKTGIFPPSQSKNPLLYFYNNRYLFLNKKRDENQPAEDSHSEGLNFSEVVRQELERLKSRYPLLSVKEDYSFDVKVFGFEKFLRTLVRELLLNSLAAMGGLKEPKLDISLKREAEGLLFSIRDYGEGIASKDYKKVFRMYYSSRSRLGVGLNVVQSLVHANEGDLELSSPQGGGLEVQIRLPLKCFLKNHFEKVEP